MGWCYTPWIASSPAVRHPIVVQLPIASHFAHLAIEVDSAAAEAQLAATTANVTARRENVLLPQRCGRIDDLQQPRQDLHLYRACLTKMDASVLHAHGKALQALQRKAAESPRPVFSKVQSVEDATRSAGQSALGHDRELQEARSVGGVGSGRQPESCVC